MYFAVDQSDTGWFNAGCINQTVNLGDGMGIGKGRSLCIGVSVGGGHAGVAIALSSNIQP